MTKDAWSCEANPTICLELLGLLSPSVAFEVLHRLVALVAVDMCLVVHGRLQESEGLLRLRPFQFFKLLC